MSFTNYSYAPGLSMLGQGIDSLGTAVQTYQKQQKLADLGQNIKSGDFDSALQTAASIDPTGGLMLKLYGLKQGQESLAKFNSGLGAIYGGGDPSGGNLSLGALGTGATYGETPSPANGTGPQSSLTPDALPAPSPIAQSDTSKQVFGFYTGKGMTPQAAAGLTGRFIRESGLDPSATNPGDGADGSTSSGVGQWNGPRGAALQQFASTNGLNPNDLRTQLEFSWQELNGPERSTLTALNAAQTPRDAATAAIGYERPAGWTPNNPTAGLGYAEGASNASDIFARFGGGNQSQVGTQVAANGSFVPRSAPAADTPVVVPGYKGTWSQKSAGATEADDSPTVDEVAKAQAAGHAALPASVSQSIAATAPASSDRVGKLIGLSMLPGLGEAQQKVLGTLLQRELDATKLPEPVKEFKFAQSAAGGGFKGTFQEWKDKSADPTTKKEYDLVVSQANAAGQQAPAYADFLKGRSERVPNLSVQAEQRTDILRQNNIDPASPMGQQYILTGNLPDPTKTAEMTADQRKMFAAAQDKTLTLQQSIADLEKAKQLNPQVYYGNYQPGAATFVHRNLPFLDNAPLIGVDPQRVAATTNFENLVTGANAALGKEMFGARVTNYDEQLLQKLRANPKMAPDERAALLDQMIAHRKETLANVQNEAAQMQAGTRFLRTPPGYSQGAPAAQPGGPMPQGAPLMLPLPSQGPAQGPADQNTPNLRTNFQGQAMPSGPNSPARPGSSGPNLTGSDFIKQQLIPQAQAGGRAPQQGAPIRVNTPADVATLPRGAHYQSPDGREWIKP
jgi:hypothetical protein